MTDSTAVREEPGADVESTATEVTDRRERRPRPAHPPSAPDRRAGARRAAAPRLRVHPSQHDESAARRGARVPPDPDRHDRGRLPALRHRPPAPTRPGVRRAGRGPVRVPAVPGHGDGADEPGPRRRHGAAGHRVRVLPPHRGPALRSDPPGRRAGRRAGVAGRVPVLALRTPLGTHLAGRVPRHRGRGRLRVGRDRVARATALGVRRARGGRGLGRDAGEDHDRRVLDPPAGALHRGEGAARVSARGCAPGSTPD